MDWDKQHSYGISYERALELEGVTDYPRISAAVFHFNKLTATEQQTVILCKKNELAEAIEERKVIYRNAKQFAKDVNHDKYIMKGMNIHPYYKERIRKDIKRLTKQIAELTTQNK